MSEAQIQDLYTRINALTEDVANLKIQAGTIGTTQTAVAQNLSLTIALSSEVRELKADMRQVKNDVSEILRILRDRNGGSGL